jgi:hypothetical protein
MPDQLIRPTDPNAHTMGLHLPRYVLPKIPELNLAGIHTIRVYGSHSLAMLLNAKPKLSKRFNWRRPDFVRVSNAIHCVTSPGQDYTRHYAELIATANMLRGQQVPVLLDSPNGFEVDGFIERWLPRNVPCADVVILGYVQHLFPNTSNPGWNKCHGFAWRRQSIADKSALMLGCEFSYWGDIAGALVSAIGNRKLAPWVVYVGKLGALDSNIRPNERLATGSHSTVKDVEIEWRSRLNELRLPSLVVKHASHITMGSVIDETRPWAELASRKHQVVDPEIGHMRLRAGLAGMDFDYLHLVTDNLMYDHGHGLYGERQPDVRRKRLELLRSAEDIIMNAMVHA